MACAWVPPACRMVLLGRNKRATREMLLLRMPMGVAPAMAMAWLPHMASVVMYGMYHPSNTNTHKTALPHTSIPWILLSGSQQQRASRMVSNQSPHLVHARHGPVQPDFHPQVPRLHCMVCASLCFHRLLFHKMSTAKLWPRLYMRARVSPVTLVEQAHLDAWAAAWCTGLHWGPRRRGRLAWVSLYRLYVPWGSNNVWRGVRMAWCVGMLHAC